ncbi:MAG TPA: beta-N-acetylhexosaminidase [Bauldia sp.]|nr:beta-N-acetylhexosaminidase [Bauldia sp.]
MIKAFISGCGGPQLDAWERDFFAAEQPWGLILFGRNCVEQQQVRDLTAAFRDAVGRPDAPVMIDQEGGRVQRLKPPHWPKYPPQRTIGILSREDREGGERAAWLHGRLIAADLRRVGVDMDCAPVIDLLLPDASDVIGDRSYGPDPYVVAALGRSTADGLLDGGVVPVMKHMPGHGRAASDSHLSLPVIGTDMATLDATDFVPFAELADLPAAMTAHVVVNAIDPDHPATTSPVVIRDIIRGRIGFDGLLMSDDVTMNALSGDYSARAASIYAAGCDLVLHCTGRTEEMREIGGAAPALGGKSRERATRALSARRDPLPFDEQAARAEYATLLARVGWTAS